MITKDEWNALPLGHVVWFVNHDSVGVQVMATVKYSVNAHYDMDYYYTDRMEAEHALLEVMLLELNN